MSDLRSKTIRLAASMPKGSLERRALLDVLAATPDWPGADAVYGYLYKVLEKMGTVNWKAEVARAKKRRVKVKPPRPSDDMETIQKALGSGDEETLKALHSKYKISRYV
jgi:hypothetical protein